MTRYGFTADGGAIIHAEPNPDLLYGTIGKLPPLSEEEQILSTRHFYRDLNRFGLTSIIDAGGGGHRFPDNYDATNAVAADGTLSLRISNCLFPQNKGRELAEFGHWTRDYQIQADLIHGLTHQYIVRGGGVSVQSRMAYAGEYFLERYGPEQTRRSPPLRSMLNAGISLGLGSDATRVASYNPWNTLDWATTGRSVGGTELIGEAYRLTQEEALFAHTVGAAWFSQEEHLKGRIAAGQFADIALLSANYFAVENDEIAHIESELTVLGGSPVYAQGPYLELSPSLPELGTRWSPVNLFGGYQRAPVQN